MDWYTIEKQALNNQLELLQEAAARTLHREILGAGKLTPRMYDRALTSLGRWLIERGRRLEEQHGECMPSAIQKSPAFSHHM